jgi:hypothetical protein
MNIQDFIQQRIKLANQLDDVDKELDIYFSKVAKEYNEVMEEPYGYQEYYNGFVFFGDNIKIEKIYNGEYEAVEELCSIPINVIPDGVSEWIQKQRQEKDEKQKEADEKRRQWIEDIEKNQYLRLKAKFEETNEVP